MNARDRAIRRLKDMLRRRKNDPDVSRGVHMERSGLASRVRMPVWARTHELVDLEQVDVESLRLIREKDWNRVMNGQVSTPCCECNCTACHSANCCKRDK
jgi:hypothetical protein